MRRLSTVEEEERETEGEREREKEGNGTTTTATTPIGSECVAVGHMIWFVDKERERLIRFNLWPIQERETLFYPADLDARERETERESERDGYTSVLFFQDRLLLQQTDQRVESDKDAENEDSVRLNSHTSVYGIEGGEREGSFPLTVLLSNVTKIQSFAIDHNARYVSLSISLSVYLFVFDFVLN
jgi:hypothetical protein